MCKNMYRDLYLDVNIAHFNYGINGVEAFANK